MAFWKVIILAVAASIFVEGKWYQPKKRETISNICDPTFNSSSSVQSYNVQCYCVFDPQYKDIVRRAECHLTKKDVEPGDHSWDGFEKLTNVTKLTLSNTRGIAIKYVPTNAIKMMKTLVKLEIKYGNIEKIAPFAFGNLTLIEEITLSDNQIKVLAINAFAHHRDLTFIGLDTNNIIEINRNVFVDLPSLEKLYLTNNKITTIHDKAFVHLENLRELEIDRNGLFSLNSETFSGLKKLQKLDLSGNSLEVIGDNTFLPLNNLKTLNLEGNKIQMLDEKAFHGLVRLYALSLAHNNLTKIDNAKTFEGLKTLTLLSLKSNQLEELKAEVMAPILSNFYGNASNLDVEDNKFPCDCRLDWFLTVMNKTQNSYFKTAIENLKCNPSDSLRELWVKTTDTEKATGQAAEEESLQGQNADYEYYDEAQLNGKLFYIDVRDLANCTTLKFTITGNAANVEITTTSTTKATSSQNTNKRIEGKTEAEKPIKENETKNKDSYTTVRLATVSAKPLEHNEVDQELPFGNARPEKIKAHRSIQDRTDASNFKQNNARANISSIFVVVVMLSFRLCF